MTRFFDHAVLITFVVVLCGPVLWLFALGLDLDVLDTFDQLRSVGPGIWSMLATSTVVALGTAALSTALSFSSAFALVFLSPRLPWFWFWITVATLYFPLEARMLQTFGIVADLGLVSTVPGLVLPVLQLALGTLLFRLHFKGLPPHLAEAAHLDGAGPLRFLRDFAVPLSHAPIAAVFLITFIWGWNQYLWPLMVSVDDRHWTVVRGLERVWPGSDTGLLLALIALVPPLLLVIAFQRVIARVGDARAGESF